jgi:hypothetical protein
LADDVRPHGAFGIIIPSGYSPLGPHAPSKTGCSSLTRLGFSKDISHVIKRFLPTKKRWPNRQITPSQARIVYLSHNTPMALRTPATVGSHTPVAACAAIVAVTRYHARLSCGGFTAIVGQPVRIGILVRGFKSRIHFVEAFKSIHGIFPIVKKCPCLRFVVG